MPPSFPTLQGARINTQLLRHLSLRETKRRACGEDVPAAYEIGFSDVYLRPLRARTFLFVPCVGNKLAIIFSAACGQRRRIRHFPDAQLRHRSSQHFQGALHNIGIAICVADLSQPIGQGRMVLQDVPVSNAVPDRQGDKIPNFLPGEQTVQFVLCPFPLGKKRL